MKERERQEKKEATMRENAAESNAKRAARAESETWKCKICDKEKNRNQHSKYQWLENRKKEAAVCLTTLRYKECGKRKGRKTGVMV